MEQSVKAGALFVLVSLLRSENQSERKERMWCMCLYTPSLLTSLYVF